MVCLACIINTILVTIAVPSSSKPCNPDWEADKWNACHDTRWTTQTTVICICLLSDAALGRALQVHGATSKLATAPASPEDFADLLDFMEKLEQRRHGLDDTYDHVCSPKSLPLKEAGKYNMYLPASLCLKHHAIG